MASMDAIAAAFNRHCVDGGGGVALLPSSRVEDTLREAGARDLGVALAMLKVLDPERQAGIHLEQFVTMAQASGQPQALPSSPGANGSSSGSGASAGSAAASATLDEGPDPKVDEFLKVLEEYRTKCEGEGNYEEAARSTEQLLSLRKQEEARRIKALKARHIAERSDVAQAHGQQYADFNGAWERYLAEYDAMASMYVKQMQDRHGSRLREFQEELHAELMRRPVKFGRELLDWRSREQLLAKQKKYSEAARIKVVADELERRERSRLDEERLSSFGQRETKFRVQQGAEQAALLKRIETRRAEHIKQRDLDSKRLLQRNRNVMAVLEQRQAQEEQRRTADIRAALAPPRVNAGRLQPLNTGQVRARGPASSSSSSDAAHYGGLDLGPGALPTTSASPHIARRDVPLAFGAARSPGMARALIAGSAAAAGAGPGRSGLR